MHKHDRLIILLLSIGDSLIDKRTNENQSCLYPLHYYLPVAFVMLLLTENIIMLPAVLFIAAPPADVILAAALVIAPPADVILPAMDVIGGECRRLPHTNASMRVLQINEILEHAKL